jgi:hypothetical protein
MVVLRMIGLVALGALVGACSDGFVPPPSGGTGATAGTGAGGVGSGGTGGRSGTGGMGGGGGIGGMGGTGGVGGVGVGDAYVDESDLEVIGMTVPNARWQASNCGTECDGPAQDEFLDCVNQCMQTQAPGLSPGCTSCYGELAWRAGIDCNTECTDLVDNICSTNCTLCPGYSTCLTELNQCAGRDSLDCLDDT